MITKHEDGTTSWDSNDFIAYNVTGVDYSGKRFKITTASWGHAQCINIYNGTRWGVTADGKRAKLQSVSN